MTFFNIVPRTTSYLNYNSDSIPLKIIRDRGLDVKPCFSVNVTELDNGFKQFTNSNQKGDKFNIKVIFEKDDTFTAVLNGKNVDKLTVMDYIIRNMIPVMVHTEALDVPNVEYLITGNPSRIQNYGTDTVWELEFTTYTPLNLVKFVNNNKAVTNAIKKASTKSASTLYQKLKKCGYKKLVYSKKKKIVPCVKTLQQVLVKNKVLSKKQVDGWYGKITLNAVKKYQKKYNKAVTVSSNNKKVYQVYEDTSTPINKSDRVPSNIKVKFTKQLPVNGKVDKATWKALYTGK